MSKSIKRNILIIVLLIAIALFQLQPFLSHKKVSGQTTETNKVWLLDGASIKMSTKDLRLRFYGCVDYKYYTENQDVEVGVIITATKYLPRVNDFTFEELDSAELRVISVKAVSFMNEQTAETDGYLQYHCDVTNIVPQNLDTEFIARPFVRRKTSADTYDYEYGGYDLTKNSRSVYKLVQYWLDNSEEFAKNQVSVLETLLYSVVERSPDSVLLNKDSVTFAFTDVKRGVIRLLGNLESYGKLTVKIDDTVIQPLSGTYYDVSKYSSGKKFSVTFERNSAGGLPETLKIICYREYRLL